jgi:hypothetical protein
MKESDWRYLVDALLFVSLGGMTVIGILMGFVISSGPVTSESSKYFLGLHRHQWGNIHAYLSIAFVVLTIVHIVLNWKWVTAKTSQVFKRRAAPVLISAVSIPFIVLFVFWLFTPKDAAKYREYGIERAERGGFNIPVPEKKAPISGEAPGRPEIPAEEEFRVEPEHQAPAHEEGDHRAVGSLVITGRMTLGEIERATGISARSIADRLGLPPSAPLNETLGRLRRLYGIEIQAVRDLVERMLKEE